MGTATATFRGDAQLCVGDGVEEQLADDDYDVAWMFDDDESLKLVAGRRIVFKLASRAGWSIWFHHGSIQELIVLAFINTVPCRTREGEDDELRSATFQFALRVRGGLMMPDVVAGLEYALETIC
uniref:Uncharacterized protein n=1 Tax=Aegilops tauschii TaxID=37682 RepID=M8BG07_AEGTA